MLASVTFGSVFRVIAGSSHSRRGHDFRRAPAYVMNLTTLHLNVRFGELVVLVIASTWRLVDKPIFCCVSRHPRES